MIGQQRITLTADPHRLPYNRAVFGQAAGMKPDGHEDRFARWWAWASEHGLNTPEYLIPQFRVPTHISPFSFEQRFVRDGRRAPSPEQVQRLDPWVYQVEMGNVSTRSMRHPADWTYHRYRKSLLIDTICQIVDPVAPLLSVLDVACHCGVFALEFAERGFGQVTALDLRPANLEQARFLAEVFDVPGVDFRMMNARDLRHVAPADIVFCAGLLYHVTFPLDLLRDLFALSQQFLVLDSLCHNYALSGFHLVCGKDTGYTAEGETHYELHPTYRALCDALYAVGFTTVYELVGDLASDIPLYAAGNVRSFVAAKQDTGLLGDFARRSPAAPDAPGNGSLIAGR